MALMIEEWDLLLAAEAAGVFEHLEYVVGEALDLVSKGGRDVVEAFVEIGGGGLDVLVELGGVAAAFGVEGVKLLIERLAEIALELGKRFLGGEALHEDLQAGDAGLDLADIGVERRLAAEECPGIVGDAKNEADTAEEHDETDDDGDEGAGVLEREIGEDHDAAPWVAASGKMRG